MILSLLFVTVIIPLLVTAGLAYLFERFFRTNNVFSLVTIIAWLPLYAWVIHNPSVPPKQAIDWLWIYLLLAIVGSHIKTKLLSNSQFIGTYQSALFLIICSVMIWPAVSYDASLSTHWLVWLENIIFGLAGAYILIKLTNLDDSANPVKVKDILTLSHFHLWLITGTLGLIVIMTGSLLVGTLLIALSSVHFSSGIYFRFYQSSATQITSKYLPYSYGVILLFLLTSRVYVEVSLSNTILLFASIGLSSYLALSDKKNIMNQRSVHILLMICLAVSTGYTVYTELLSAKSNAYY